VKSIRQDICVVSHAEYRSLCRDIEEGVINIDVKARKGVALWVLVNTKHSFWYRLMGAAPSVRADPIRISLVYIRE
jgi:hypothetical protein